MTKNEQECKRIGSAMLVDLRIYVSGVYAIHKKLFKAVRYRIGEMREMKVR